MNNVEIWANAIQQSINEGPSPEGVDSSEHEQFYPVAEVIVEPLMHDEQAQFEYGNFLEGNSENWANWIRQTFGGEWGRIAQIVAEEGY